MQVIGKELFGLLRETHGKGFQAFIEEKVVALAGDIIHENFGVEGAQLSEMTREINVIVNGAATTNFYERSVVVFVVRQFSSSQKHFFFPFFFPLESYEKEFAPFSTFHGKVKMA